MNRNHTAGAVLAIKQRLRPFQHFDLPQVEHACIQHLRTVDAHTIHVDGYRLIECRVSCTRADTAQVNHPGGP